MAVLKCKLPDGTWEVMGGPTDTSGDSSGSTDTSNVLRYSAQELTETQRKQARTNISAASLEANSFSASQTINDSSNTGLYYMVIRKIDEVTYGTNLMLTSTGNTYINHLVDGVMDNNMTLYSNKTSFKQPITMESGGLGSATLASAPDGAIPRKRTDSNGNAYVGYSTVLSVDAGGTFNSGLSTVADGSIIIKRTDSKGNAFLGSDLVLNLANGGTGITATSKSDLLTQLGAADLGANTFTGSQQINAAGGTAGFAMNSTINKIDYRTSFYLNGDGNTIIGHSTDGTNDNYLFLGPTYSYFNKPLSITGGGTGANSKEGALTNLGAVPTTRTVNGKALNSNITIGAGDITSGKLAIANGGTNATDRAAASKNINYLGSNPLTAKSLTDTPANWSSLGYGYAYIDNKSSNDGALINSPSSYASYLINLTAGGNTVYQMLFPLVEQARVWMRAGNTDGWKTDWVKSFSAADTIPVAQGGTGATTKAAARTNLGALSKEGNDTTAGVITSACSSCGFVANNTTKNKSMKVWNSDSGYCGLYDVTNGQAIIGYDWSAKKVYKIQGCSMTYSGGTLSITWSAG